jgi:hypothetical protein
MYKTKAKSSEGYQFFLSSIKYDYALLRLATPVMGRRYPTLVPGFKKERHKVSVCGYSEPASQEYYQIMHSNPLLYREEGARYDIDTTGGQSGSPVFYMKQTGNEEVCHQVGIHKGYDKIVSLNVCTLITEEVVARLREWTMVMGVTFRVSQTEEKKEAVGHNQKMEEKNKDEEIAKLGKQI